jgi:hypothetical protein
VSAALDLELQEHDEPRAGEGADVRPRRNRVLSLKQIASELRRGGGRDEAADPELAEIRRELDEVRPRRRIECADIPRPCPFFSCRWNLYLDVNPATGSIKLNFPDRDLEDLEETCALDVADRGGSTLERVGEVMNITRERIRQIETLAGARVHDAMKGRMG